MALILAIEPDRRQAAQLTAVIRKRVGAELVLADTTERALTAIGSKVPDLVLVPALLSPQDDAALATALRVIASAAQVQMLTIPVLAPPAQSSGARGVFSALRRSKPHAASPDGCDPAVFADQILSYLKSAAEEREAAAEMAPAASEAPAADTGTVAPQAPIVEAPVEEPIQPPAELHVEPIVELYVEPIVAVVVEPVAEVRVEAVVAVPIEVPVDVPVEAPIEAVTVVEPADDEDLVSIEDSLLETSAVVDAIDENAWTPLVAAARWPRLDIAVRRTVPDPVPEVAPIVISPSPETAQVETTSLADADIQDVVTQLVIDPDPVFVPVVAIAVDPIEAVPAAAAEEFSPATPEAIDELDPTLLEIVRAAEAAEAEQAALALFPEAMLVSQNAETAPIEETPEEAQVEQAEPGQPLYVAGDEGAEETDQHEDPEAAIDVFEIGVMDVAAELAALGADDRIAAIHADRMAWPDLWLPLSARALWPHMEGVIVEGAPAIIETASAIREPAAEPEVVRAPEPAPEPVAAAPAVGPPPEAVPDWVSLIESLRRDIERLRTERAQPEPIAQAAAAAPAIVPVAPSAQPESGTNRRRRRKKQAAIENEWGFFDPEQCGFSALLAKLDEVTAGNEEGAAADELDG